MKTTTHRETLVTALSKAIKFSTGVRTQNENLGMFLTFEPNSITVLGISETRYFQEKIACGLDIPQKIMVTLDTKRLLEFLQTITSEEIHLSLEKNGVKIRAEKTNALFPIVPRQTIPEVPQGHTNSVTLDPKVVLATLPYLLFCVASDSARPTLGSIKCIPQGDKKVLFVTTDGFRLSLVHTSFPTTLEQSLQIPATSFRDAFFSVLNENEKTNMLFHEDGKLSFAQGDILVGTQLVSGDFPPYERVLVRNFQQNIIVSRKDLIQSTKTIAIFAREHSNIVVFEPSTDSLRIRPKKEAGTENNTELPIELQGQDPSGLVVAFNHRYLLDFLSVVEDDFVTIRINRPDSPILFLAGKFDAADSHEGASFQHIIMPVRIQE